MLSGYISGRGEGLYSRKTEGYVLHKLMYPKTHVNEFKKEKGFNVSGFPEPVTRAIRFQGDSETFTWTSPVQRTPVSLLLSSGSGSRESRSSPGTLRGSGGSVPRSLILSFTFPLWSMWLPPLDSASRAAKTLGLSLQNRPHLA